MALTAEPGRHAKRGAPSMVGMWRESCRGPLCGSVYSMMESPVWGLRGPDLIPIVGPGDLFPILDTSFLTDLCGNFPAKGLFQLELD